MPTTLPTPLVYFSFDTSDSDGLIIYNLASGSSSPTDPYNATMSMSNLDTTTDYKFGDGSLLLDNTQEQYITIPSFPSNLNDGYTFAIWFKGNSTIFPSRFFDFSNGPDTFNVLAFPTGNYIQFGRLDYQLNSSPYSGVNINDNSSWNHFAWVIEPTPLNTTLSTWYVYLNGTLTNTYTGAPNINLSSKSVNYLGKAPWTSDPYYNGGMDEFFIFNAPLTSEQITLLYTNNINFNSNSIVCFLEGTNILSLNDENKEEYIPIEKLRKGMLVKTLTQGFVPVNMIGRSTIINNTTDERIKDRLYCLSKEKYPELTEDLIITGCHSILVDSLNAEQCEKTVKDLGNIFATEGKYRLMAYLDEKAVPYKEKGIMAIYHLALDNNDYYKNYGIYANGLLAETCSQRYLKELSGMELLGEETVEEFIEPSLSSNLFPTNILEVK